MGNLGWIISWSLVLVFCGFLQGVVDLLVGGIEQQASSLSTLDELVGHVQVIERTMNGLDVPAHKRKRASSYYVRGMHRIFKQFRLDDLSIQTKCLMLLQSCRPV